MDKERLLAAAIAYVDRGWWPFVVSGVSKVPFANCERCRPGAHSGAVCACLTCHGHLAATRDPSRLRAMIWKYPVVALALATGPSGLVVLDVEGDDRCGYGQTGLEVLDNVEAYTGGVRLPLDGVLRARSAGGGVHLYYKGQATSTNKLFPNIDVKSRGGYVLVPPAQGRSWDNWSTGVVATWPLGFVSAVEQDGKKRDSWTGGVRSLSSLVVAGENGAGGRVPAGARYEFTRDMVYKLRKQGVSWEEAHQVMRDWWMRYDQPPVAKYELPWSQVEYELERVWQRVTPSAGLSATRAAWVAGLRGDGAA